LSHDVICTKMTSKWRQSDECLLGCHPLDARRTKPITNVTSLLIPPVK